MVNKLEAEIRAHCRMYTTSCQLPLWFLYLQRFATVLEVLWRHVVIFVNSPNRPLPLLRWVILLYFVPRRMKGKDYQQL